MTTDLEQRLRDALREDAARARLLNPDAPPALDGPPLLVEHHRWRGLRWVAVAAAITLLVFVAGVAIRDGDQKVETVPPASESLPRSFELVDTAWMFVGTSDGPVDSDMVFTADTVSWDTGCARMGASYELDRDDGFLILTNVETLSGTCGPPTTFGLTKHYPIIDAVMGSARIPITLDDGRLYLGDHPDGDYVVLEPVVPSDGVEGAPPALPEPGEQPADPAAAEEQVRAAFTGLYDASVPREDRAQFVDRPEVWLPLNQALFESQYGEILRDLHAVVDSLVFTSRTHAAVRFQLLASDPRVPGEYAIGDAVLIDGRWVVDVTTPCSTAEATGFACDFTP